MSPFVGEIRMFAGNFAPAGWALCNGQVLDVSENPALYSLIGNLYGGDGGTTFALPDMRGRTPIHQGQGNGLTLREIGTALGEEKVALAESEMPAHTHTLPCSGKAADQYTAKGNVWAANSANDLCFSASSPTAGMSPAAITSTGGGQGHDNMMPFQVIGYIIALDGIYPSQN